MPHARRYFNEENATVEKEAVVVSACFKRHFEMSKLLCKTCPQQLSRNAKPSVASIYEERSCGCAAAAVHCTDNSLCCGLWSVWSVADKLLRAHIDVSQASRLSRNIRVCACAFEIWCNFFHPSPKLLTRYARWNTSKTNWIHFTFLSYRLSRSRQTL